MNFRKSIPTIVLISLTKSCVFYSRLLKFNKPSSLQVQLAGSVLPEALDLVLQDGSVGPTRARRARRGVRVLQV